MNVDKLYYNIIPHIVVLTGIHIIYECASASTEITEVQIDIYTYMEDTGEEFCRLFFKFGKYCEMESEPKNM